MVVENKELIYDSLAGRHSCFERIEVVELITLRLIHVMEVVVNEDSVLHEACLTPAFRCGWHAQQARRHLQRIVGQHEACPGLEKLDTWLTG